MKLKLRLASAALSLALGITPVLTPAARAMDFYSVKTLQQFLENTSPAAVSATGAHHATVAGTVLEITHTGPNNHHDMLLEAVGQEGYSPQSYDNPVIHVHFRLHVDPCPFAVGDEIAVRGELNSLYSSVMIPWLLAEEINGSDEF